MVLLWRVGSRKGCLESRYVIDLVCKNSYSVRGDPVAGEFPEETFIEGRGFEQSLYFSELAHRINADSRE